ncbi:MAG TPA: hypothetical protein VK607_17220, partial [Kofleriaceae bacterium]|nr:hypothetical protein [Kofleriaceae bacterium]
ELTLTIADQITVVAPGGLGAGTLEVLVEDERGVRKSIASVTVKPTADAAPLTQVATPAAGARVLAVFRGSDAGGEPVVAVGAMPLTH